MFELFDLPNEKELAQIMLEGAKKAKSESSTVDTKTIFPFWEPPGSAKKTVAAPDKTGAVKVKPAVDMKDSKTTLDKVVKPELYDEMTKPQTRVIENGQKVPPNNRMFNHYSGAPEVKVVGGKEKKGPAIMSPDKTGVVKPKGLVTAK